MKKLLIIVVIIINLAACQSHERNIISHYQNSPEDFKAFKALAYKDEALLSQQEKFVGINELNSETKEALQSLNLSEVKYIILGKKPCLQNNEHEIEIIFDSNWHLMYEPCRTGAFEIGDYDEKGSIESWKIDKNWSVWVNNDFIG